MSSEAKVAYDSHTDLSHLRGKPAADIVNALDIRGQLFVAHRGKEYVLAVHNETASADDFVFRISLGLEAHAFWMPTTSYYSIINGALEQRGKKSWAFGIPPELFDGPPGTKGQISIQMAFIRPDWTLVFADHNVMIAFHVMRLRKSCERNDFTPGSQLWPYLWSHTHGPDLHKEPEEFKRAFERWRVTTAAQLKNKPIILEVRDNQRVFNGYGAQETCDMLFVALIHPGMPSYQICRNDVLSSRLLEALIKYRNDRVTLLDSNRLPLVSSPRPFRFNAGANKFFLQQVLCCRRYHVAVDQATLTRIHELNLLDPDAIIQDTGEAIVTDTSPSLSIISPRPAHVAKTVRGRTMWLPNYEVKLPSSQSGALFRTVYTPFVAQGAESWWPIESMRQLSKDEDVIRNENKTTLGPYSFHVFVAAAWTSLHIGDVMPVGRRPLTVIGKSHTKRPRASDLQKGGGRDRKRKKECSAQFDENDSPEKAASKPKDMGRITRSMTRNQL